MRRTLILIGAAAIAVVLFYYLRPNLKATSGINTSAGNFIFLEKNSGWGPCPPDRACSQEISVWSGGLVEYKGEVTKDVTLTSSQINQIADLIDATGILSKRCAADTIVDYGATYAFHPSEKTIVFPGCRAELDQIDILIRQLTGE